jgi:hypothetical protein
VVAIVVAIAIGVAIGIGIAIVVAFAFAFAVVKIWPIPAKPRLPAADNVSGLARAKRGLRHKFER